MLNLSSFVKLEKENNFIYSRVEKVGSHQVIQFSYVYNANTKFNTETLVNCRGITFDLESGELLALPFPKFFNIEESGTTLTKDLKIKKIMYASKKLDGSLIFPILLDGDIHMCTKLSTTNKYAVKSTNIVRNSKAQSNFIKGCKEKNITPLFEYTSPENQIILHYPNEELTLIGLRCEKTGECIPLDQYKIPSTIKVTNLIYNVTIESLLETAKTKRGEEGVVVLFSDGQIVKIKNIWYTKNHHAISLMRTRDIAKSHLSGYSDDIISTLNIMGNNSKLKAYKEGVKIVDKYYLNLQQEVDTLILKIIKAPSSKLAWQEHGHSSLYKVAINIHKKKMSLGDYILRKRIKDFDLDKLDEQR